MIFDYFLSFRVNFFIRSAPRRFVILANQISVAVDMEDPAVISTLTHSSEEMFAGLLLTSKTLQVFGIYQGTNEI